MPVSSLCLICALLTSLQFDSTDDQHIWGNPPLGGVRYLSDDLVATSVSSSLCQYVSIASETCFFHCSFDGMLSYSWVSAGRWYSASSFCTSMNQLFELVGLVAAMYSVQLFMVLLFDLRMLPNSVSQRLCIYAMIGNIPMVT